MRLKRNRPEPETAELKRRFGNSKKYRSVRSDTSGNIISIDTTDRAIIVWARSKGLI